VCSAGGASYSVGLVIGTSGKPTLGRASADREAEELRERNIGQCRRGSRDGDRCQTGLRGKWRGYLGLLRQSQSKVLREGTKRRTWLAWIRIVTVQQRSWTAVTVWAGQLGGRVFKTCCAYLRRILRSRGSLGRMSSAGASLSRQRKFAKGKFFGQTMYLSPRAYCLRPSEYQVPGR
jgi:hypothetical protein